MTHPNSISNIDQFVEDFIFEFQKGLPGAEAQKKMSPSLRNHSHNTNDPSLARDSSVLILFYQKGNKIYFPLIKRTNGGHRHSGQISLPGGKFELSDKNLVDTAIRETEEELGLLRDRIQIIGPITGLYIPISNFQVQPIVAFYEGLPEFKADSFEVYKVIETDIQELFKAENKKIKTLHKNGFDIRAPFYQVQEHMLWGATAMIVSELEELLKRAGLIG
ncbi:CoA pyrophosphatase [Ancylomarina sp. DW003]|nr:CoA pyrophosphatase [Ancylomarina sp. DW003]MDE5423827.1 CoA pyrophosphatase [Ancylomarina sp. DW003]